ncbi:MAG: DUF456 domain-containing protein [Planctomycetota bacterium]|nr:DUF456 domain-containing protein [Planctomycetota bacterium]
MDWILYIVATLFFLIGAGCLLLVVIGLPGGWIMLGVAGLIEWADQYYLPEESSQTFDWWVFIACGVLLAIGELVEFLASAAGAKKGGASRRGMVGALIGGFVGVFLFAGLLSVVPLVGTILGAFLGALLGTFLGALIGEMSGEEGTVKGSVKPALGATAGRVLGTASKLGIAISVWFVLSFSAFLN